MVSSDYATSCCISNCDSLIPWLRVERNPCDVTITVPTAMEPPIYMYYKLTDFYQNHRRYVRSREDKQLKGDYVPLADLEETASCQYHVNSSAGPISPCGLMAWSVFNDSYALATSDGASIALNETGIAWSSDLEYKFKNSANGSTGTGFPPFAQWRNRACADLPTVAKREACEAAGLEEAAGWCYPGSGYCVEDEHFAVWMRAAGLPNFRKLYAKIETRLEPGTYTVSVSNGVNEDGTYVNKWTGAAQPFLYPVSSFGGTKSVVLSTTTWMGGRNFFLGYAYVVVGVVCVVLALCFLMKYRMAPRDLGDASYITWQKEGSAATM